MPLRTPSAIRRLMPAAVLLLAASAPARAAGSITVAGDAVAGRQVFATTCANCHQIGHAARGGFAPQLNGIIGRRAGSTTDFHYSDAMKKPGFVWTEARLRAFLHSPDDVVPGNKMRFWGIGSDHDIDNLLAYLRTYPSSGRP